MNSVVMNGADILNQLPMMAAELALLGGALLLLLVGLYGPKAANGLHHGIAALAVLVAGVFVVDGFGAAPQMLFNQLVITDDYGRFAQLLVLGATLMVLGLSISGCAIKRKCASLSFRCSCCYPPWAWC